MKTITSRDNALLKRLRRLLTTPAARRELGGTLLDGTHLISAYLEQYGPHGMDVVVDAQRLSHPEIAALVARIGERVHSVDPALLKGVSPSDHPAGIVAAVPIPPSPADVQAGDALLLDRIQDPGNVGALLRTACAAGFQRVYLSAGCADVWSPRCLRGGMGAQFHLRLEEDADLARAMAAFDGVTVACDAGAGTDLYDLPWHAPVGVLMGAEGDGLRPELLAAATQRCRIPMAPGVESLNVAVAAAVVMYEVVRRRSTAGA